MAVQAPPLSLTLQLRGGGDGGVNPRGALLQEDQSYDPDKFYFRARFARISMILELAGAQGRRKNSLGGQGAIF